MRNHQRAGNTVAVVVAALAAFSVVLGVLFYASQSKPAPADSVVANDTNVKPQAQPVEPSKPAPAPVKQDIVIDEIPQQAPVPANTDKEAFNAAEAVASTTSDLRPGEEAEIEAHLAAGEYGQAMDIAQKIADVRRRSMLLKHVADAQFQAGEFDGAMTAIGRIPMPAMRGEARGQRASELAGGGSLADFTQLIDLIQNETSGPWIDIDGTGGSISEYDTGVRVDPNGVLALLTKAERKGRLNELGIRARKADLNEDMAKSSSLRVVSLTRLEQEVARKLASGQQVPTSMKHLAGLQQVKYVFADRATGEIMIAGPAEAWEYNEQGLPVGIENGTPMLHLDDLVTVMRIFAPAGSNIFNCLIVPRQQNLKAFKALIDQINASGGKIAAGGAGRNAARFAKVMGMQDAEFGGVPADSRVARVMLEADYKMKLIGIDKLDVGNATPSYFDLLDATAIEKNPPELVALRWWLTMKYDAVLHSPDRSAFEFQGSSVRCQSENELVDSQGKRIHTGKASPVNKMFAVNFTKNYAKIASRELVFADLQNIFDLALVAALVRQQQLVGYPEGYGVFGPEGEYQPVKYTAPKEVPSAANYRRYGRDIITQVAGGVRADLMAVLRDEDVFKPAERLGNAKPATPNLPAGRWWWDAK